MTIEARTVEGPIRDLFTKLYAYRQRDSRDPLEDWLTECLAAVLRALPIDQLGPIIAQLTSRPQLDVELVLQNRRPSIVTQFSTQAHGRPDLVILLHDEPWIVFENKVAHQVDDQLDRYGAWLASIRGAVPWRALVYVTHVTQPPADFSAEIWAERHHGVSPAVTSWGRLSRLLLGLTADVADTLSRSLAESFYNMLESLQMADEFPSSQSYAALEIFLSQAGPLENLVARMWEQVCHSANSAKLGSHSIEADPEYGCYAASRYVQRAPNNDSGWSFIETGIWFPSLQRWWSAEQLGSTPRGPQVYLFFGNADDQVLAKVEGTPLGWSRPAGQFFCCKSILDFPSQIDAQAASVLDWCRSRADELKTFLISNELTQF